MPESSSVTSGAGSVPAVRLCQVLAGAVPFKLGNVNDTYRGVVLTDTGEKVAMIKDLEPKELANEVLGAAVAICLGLPIPPPYLAWASSDRFAARKGPKLGDGRLVYASVEVSQPQIAMLYAGGARKQVLARLAKWRELGRLYGFDALVANVDRHEGNLLFSGNREVWLIDHGYCFTGPNWTPVDLSPADKAVSSRLQGWLTPVLSDTQRNAIASTAALVERATGELDLEALARSNHLVHLLTESDLAAVLSFLSDRYRHVPKLAAGTLGLDWIL